MRSTITILLTTLFLISITTAAVPTDCTPSTEWLGYLQFEGNTNDGMSKISANSPTATYHYDMYVGQGINLSTMNSPLTLSGLKLPFNTASNPGQQFTIAFWLLTESNQDSEIELIDFDNGFKITMGPDWIAFVTPKSGVIANGTRGTGTKMYTFVWEYSGSGTMKIYENNNLIKTGTGFTSLNINNKYPGTAATIPNPTGTTTISLDELAFLNVAWDATEVSENRQKGGLNGKDYCITTIAGVSSTETDFSVAGCKLPDGRSIDKNSCTVKGDYYCNDQEQALLTDAIVDACTMGFTSYTPGKPMCCQQRKICTDQGSGGSGGVTGDFYCEQADLECSTYDGDSSGCLDAGCFYIAEGENRCVTSPGEFSCSVYKTKDPCLQDNYNVGGIGVGTEICESTNNYFEYVGGQFVVPSASCGCVWDNNECKLAWNYTEALHGGTPAKYQCLNSFEEGACINGKQTINWTTETRGGTGILFNLPETSQYRKDPGCINGTTQRSCGEPVVKLPGFSMIATILSICIIGLFYILRPKTRNDL